MTKHDDTPKTAQELLEARVDAMMDPHASKSEDTTPTPVVGAPTLPGKAAKPAAAAAKPEPVSQETAAAEPAPTPPEPVDAPEPAAPEAPLAPSQLDTPESDAAVDDIVAQEADEVLAAEDAGVAAAERDAQAISEAPQKRGHPIFWFLILLLVIVAILTAVTLVHPDALP